MAEHIPMGDIQNGQGGQFSETFAKEQGDGISKGGRVAAKYMGTLRDQEEMRALGKEQVLRREFDFFSVLGFGSTLIATWEFVLTLLSFGMLNGGTAGLIYGFIIISAGAVLVFASIAEIASMAPTAGGQYHWVSEFAPRSAQKYLSYLTGWLCAVGWQLAVVAISFMAGGIIQGLIILNEQTYVPEAWHGTLFIIGITAFSVVFNTLIAKKLPLVETLLLVLHVVGLFVTIIPLWVLAPRNSPKAVFTEFNNSGGWSSMGTSFMIGMATSMPSMLGYDSAVHMSEETKDASRTLPKAIMMAVAVNGSLGFIMLVTLCFTMGDVNKALESGTGFPFIHVYYNATQNYAGTSIMVTLVIISLTASVISDIATSSRQIWSFARDGGLPFSNLLSQVPGDWNIPLNAVIVSLMATVLLSLINLGSTVALNAITSLTTSVFISSYVICIICILLRRIRGEPLPERRWSLGRWGIFFNIGALCFLCPMFFFAFFPLTVSPTLETMNWAAVMYVGIMGISTVYYFLYGRFQYTPPVTLVKRGI